MADDITVKIVADTKQLQTQINNSSLSKDQKSVLSAKISESLSLLDKGAKATGRDLNIVSGNLRSVIKELVNAAAGAKGISKEFTKAQRQLEAAMANRKTLKNERANITRSIITPDGKLRTSAADQWTKGLHITGSNGKEIRTYETLLKASQDNPRAAEGIKTISGLFQGQQNRLKQIDTVDLPKADALVEEARKKVQEAGDKIPSGSAAVQVQEFGNELQKLIDNLRDANTQISGSGSGSNDVGVNPQQDLVKLNSETNKTTTNFKGAFKQFSIYAIAARTLKKAITEAISTIKQLDSSLTEQAMVTGKTREQTYALLSSYQELASQTGATTREVAELATQFMRQGKTSSDALTLTEAAMDAAKVAGISATDSVNYLTTALNGFQMSAEDAMSVSDKFAAIAANSATSYDEIATALSKVASQANLAGMSIDYTTALLAKGLETTREAPETMGTALKTVIARMRELSDYGETLGGDTDVNNVESQLAYVGIALRDNNGELRSTEDVLDELGKKWGTLNSNQQAAIAKSLAGTRQQSRLIAMMTDYERVIELQEISERSSGATLAQMSTYLDGMDAALNKVSVAWEKITTSISDSQFIINAVNAFSTILENINKILSSTGVLVTLTVALGAAAVIALGTKMKEYTLAKQEALIQKQINKNAREQQIIEAKTYLQQLETTKQKWEQVKADAQKVLLDKNSTEQQKLQATASLQEANNALDNIELQRQKVNLLEQQNTYLNNQDSLIGNIQNGLSGLTAPLFMIITLWKTISGLITIVSKKQDAQHAKTMSQAMAENQVNATNAAGKIISNLGVWGIPLAVAVAAALGAVALGITAAISSTSTSAEDKAAKDINNLSNEIYKLETKARAIDTIIDSYDELDKKIVKTKADQEEMNDLLDQAADKLTDEEQIQYNKLTTSEQKTNYLKAIRAEARENADKDRLKQVSNLNNLSKSEQLKLLDSNTTDNKALTAQSALYAINNSYLYKYIDALDDAKEGVEDLAQSLLEELTPAQALAYANQPEQIEQLVKSLNSLDKEYTSLNNPSVKGSVAEVLTSDDYGIVDKIDAYTEALSALTPEMKEYLKTVYSDLNTLSGFGSTVLKYFDNKNITVNQINAIGKAINKLGYEGEEATNKIQQLFAALASGSSLQDAIQDVFRISSNSDAYRTLINAYGNAIGTGILNMGQNIETLKNTIDSFYEKAQKWSEMSDSEKTDFISSNAELFSGEDGTKLLQAIESGDYNYIQQALSTNSTLSKKVAQRIADIDAELEIERAKTGDDYNAVYIKYLEDTKKTLEDADNLFAASLETRLEQEQKYIDEYKSYLEDQEKELEDSLNKRKDAYQKYFDAVNQEADDEDFEKQESTLIANIGKLSTTNSAEAINQSKQLEESLKELEEERIKTLRERAQEEIIQNIEDQLDDISEKFDKLLDSNQALLAAMTGELNTPEEFLSKLIANKATTSGLTDLGLQDYIQDLRTTYSSLIGNDIFDNITATREGDKLILNVAGTEVELSDTDQQTIYMAIKAALQQIGYR